MRAGFGRDVVVARLGDATRLADFQNDAVRGSGGRAAAVAAAASIIDDDACAFTREEQRNGAANAVASASDDRDLVVQKSHAAECRASDRA